MLLRLLILLALCGSVWLSNSEPASAQSQAFEAGYQAYMRNQFPLAEAHFRRALGTAKTPEDKAFILKFLGISQFMRGARRQAAMSFYQAYRADPKTSIYKEEVLDPSVVNFFNSLKNRWIQKQRQSSRPRATGKRQPRNAQSPNRRARTSAQRSKKPGKAKAPQQKAGAKSQEQEPQQQAEQQEDRPSSLSWWHFMPFGAGQFYNGQIWTGSFFAVSQLTAGVVYQVRQSEISDEQAENQSVLNSSLPTAEKDSFIESNNEYITALEDDAQLALIGFGTAWATSIIHAILTAPSPKDMPDSEGNTPTAQRLDLNLEPGETLDDIYRSPPSLGTQFSVMPQKNGGWVVSLKTPLP